ncbi:MAG: Rieske (2Fe-2S) protein [Cytophagales bacterium]|nr:MAG: Rieske (2Fe-2S) protein [Cytophagales bacterium]TAF61460.1 MAG: Rieske (2Fe-2S) protein [Cytophagales bacterium]
MTRWEFLRNLGLSGAAIFAVTCAGGTLSSCKEEEEGTPTPVGSNFTLDLDAPENSKLNTVGGFIIKDKVVVALVAKDTFVAVTQICSHEGNAAVSFNASSGEFVCSVHGARFDKSGKGLNRNGEKGLKTYKTSLSGRKLTVSE